VSEEGFSVAAYAVITNDAGEVLLTRREDGDEWVLPGGSVEEAEAPWEAVAREVREETSLDVDLGRLVGVYAKKRERDLVFVFDTAAVRGEPRPSDERDRVEYFDTTALPDGTSKQDRERIADALADAAVPVLATQPSQGEEPLPGTR
jgi:8-oxo-dGTP diphosphatase